MAVLHHYIDEFANPLVYASRLAGRVGGVGALKHSRRNGFGRDTGSDHATSQGRAQRSSTELVRVEGAVVIQLAIPEGVTHVTFNKEFDGWFPAFSRMRLLFLSS